MCCPVSRIVCLCQIFIFFFFENPVLEPIKMSQNNSAEEPYSSPGGRQSRARQASDRHHRERRGFAAASVFPIPSSAKSRTYVSSASGGVIRTSSIVEPSMRSLALVNTCPPTLKSRSQTASIDASHSSWVSVLLDIGGPSAMNR